VFAAPPPPAKETQLDAQICRQVWEGALPLVLRLRRAEVCALQPPHAVYIMASRGVYLPLLMSECRAHFAQAVSSESRDQEMWLEANGVPLRWHLPLGVLYDHLCGGLAPISASSSSLASSHTSSSSSSLAGQISAPAEAQPSSWAAESSSSFTHVNASSSLDVPPAGGALLSGHLPWELTVRFAGFPSSRILHCPSLRTVEQHFMNMLKQVRNTGQVSRFLSFLFVVCVRSSLSLSLLMFSLVSLFCSPFSLSCVFSLAKAHAHSRSVNLSLSLSLWYALLLCCALLCRQTTSSLETVLE
jgi:Autophagy protein ATG5, UblA domain